MTTFSARPTSTATCYDACLQNPGCTAVQTWGFTDKYSWIGSHSHGARGGALLFDKSYKPKPAYAAVLEELSSHAMRGH